jgi:hypothetical protein
MGCGGDGRHFLDFFAYSEYLEFLAVWRSL